MRGEYFGLGPGVGRLGMHIEHWTYSLKGNKRRVWFGLDIQSSLFRRNYETQTTTKVCLEGSSFEAFCLSHPLHCQMGVSENRVPYFGVLIIRILLFRVQEKGPLFSETPTCTIQGLRLGVWGVMDRV